MNWRGILGIYAGLAIVLAGGWFWVQSSALWALGVVTAGVAVVGLSVAQILLKRRGPRSPENNKAKSAKETRAARAKGVVNAGDAQADSVAKARMAMIAERAAGQMTLSDALAVVFKNGDDVEHAEPGQVPDVIESDVAVALSAAASEEAIPSGADAVDLADVSKPLDALELPPVPGPLDMPDLTGMRAWSATLGAAVMSKRIASAALPVEPESEIEIASEIDGEPKSASDEDDILETTKSSDDNIALAVQHRTPDAEAAHNAVTEEAAEVTVEAAPAPYEADPVALVTSTPEKLGPVALDSLPGFPWTARFIGIWAREVRFACPAELRDAVIHWQRWADGQAAGSPVIEEAAAEFNAMLDVWRARGEDVLGVSSDGWTAGQLAAEAGEDAALAALLPEVLRAQSAAAY